ncbi:alpha/beta fold hydrolase [Pacificimonas flava]|nr:alpha/beta fold hydrolase [Pacificimonas flava]
MTDWSWIPPRSLDADLRMQPANGLDFELVAAGPRRAKRAVLMLHGFPELNLSWRHQIAFLAERGWRVWAPNLRGYGATSRPEGLAAYRLDALTADVAALLSALRTESGAEEIVLMAHDWGGAIAWDAAMRRVRPMDRLVIMNMPHPYGFARALRLSRAQRRRSRYIAFFQLPRLPERLLGARDALAIRRVFTGMATNAERFPPEILDIYARAAQRPGALTAMLNYYRAAVRLRGTMSGRDPVVDIPVLLIWGTADTALGQETLDGIGAYVPHLTRRYLPGISHWVQQDAPDLVNAHLADWLETPVPG